MKNLLNILILCCFVFAVSNASASPPGEKEVLKTEITKHQTVDLQINVAMDVVYTAFTNAIVFVNTPSNIFRAENKPLIVTNAKANLSDEVKPPDIYTTLMNNRLNHFAYDSTHFEYYYCNYL